ncbi:MAG TPA: S9 family peptidase [Devosiaceae bacterium]|nr:S9 family peptidase [Devosiaceae bacterium]
MAAVRSHRASHHGVERQDSYHWLRAVNWQQVMREPQTLPEDIRAYLEAENAYYEAAFGEPTEALRETIYKEIRGRIKEDDTGVPSPDGPYAYYSRMETGKQYPVLVRTSSNGGEETVLLDCNVEAGDGYFGFGGTAHDPAHRYLAWSADRNGSEFYTVHVRDTRTGADLEEALERTGGGVAWGNDGRSLFYTVVDDNHRPYRVCMHTVGTPVSEDRIVFTESDPGFFVGIGKTQSRKYIVIDVHDHQTSEIYLIDADDPASAPQLVAARQTGREYEIEERFGTLYVLTNDAGAEDFKIAVAGAEAPAAANWRDLVPHCEGVLILSFFVIENHLVRLELAEGLPRIVVRDLEGGGETSVHFEEEAYSLGVSPGYEFETETIRFTYSSPTTPMRIYDYSVATGERVLRKQQEIPSGHNPADYVTRRLFAPADDGEQVPVTILHRADSPPGPNSSCLLYGYGAYGLSTPAAFSASHLSLVDRGFVYAIAHVRGGKDKGYRWYRLGKGTNKVNTFSDFIAAAETLIERGLTGRGRIVAEGGSAGGMLMGAVVNMRPDLFAGIVAHVPFVDVLNTMLDDSLPLTPPEWPEWGNPAEAPEAYATIAGYSPYDNIVAQDYPPILAMAGLTDPRVTYWESAKWVAKLRAIKTDDNPIYLKTNMGAGHGGASGRFDRIKETAIAYAFACVVTRADNTG